MNPATRSALIGGTVMTVIAATIALGRGPVPAHQLRDKPFQDAFREDLATLAAASERIELLGRPRVVPVETIKAAPDPLMLALSEPSEPAIAPPPPAKRKAAVGNDICSRHGLRKVHYGNRWRCRK